MLERQVGRLENYPEMRERMQRHIEESREQARRLEELLAGHDTSHSALKDTMMSIVGNLAAMGHSTASDEVVKNTFAALPPTTLSAGRHVAMHGGDR